MALTTQQQARYALIELDPAHVDQLLAAATTRARLFDRELLSDMAANALWTYAFDLARLQDPRSRTAEWLSHVIRQLDDGGIHQFAAFTAWLAAHHAEGFPAERLRAAILCLGIDDLAAVLRETREDEAAEDVEPVSEVIEALSWRVARAFHGSTVPGDRFRAAAAQLLADALAAGRDETLAQIEALVSEQQALRRQLGSSLGLDHPDAAGSSRRPALELPELPEALRTWFTRQLIYDRLERRWG